MTYEEFKTIATLASACGHEINIEEEYNRVIKKYELESKLNEFFNELILHKKISQLRASNSDCAIYAQDNEENKSADES